MMLSYTVLSLFAYTAPKHNIRFYNAGGMAQCQNLCIACVWDGLSPSEGQQLAVVSSLKGGRQLVLVQMNFRMVSGQRFLGMLSPNLVSILGYLYSLRIFPYFLVGTHDSFCWFLKNVKS